MNGKSLKHTDKTNLLYLGLIFLVWLVSYIICQIVFKQKLGWDEVAYMSVAKGIVSDFDFSARAYTIMGILKHGYPTNLINFPIFPIYLAVFFKLFGFSLKVAYFSSWLAALGTCILIYLTFLLVTKSSYKTAFLVSIAYLFCPGVIKNCDSAMMEQAGCFLLMLSTYLIFQDYAKGKFNYFTVLKISLCLLVLWLFKSLFIGFFIGAFVFIYLAYKHKLTSILLCFGAFAVLYYILKKYVFYPVAPMMTFSPIQEYTQVYADFLGGYFNNFSTNFLRNLSYFFSTILAPYFVYPAGFLQYTGELLNTPGHFIFLGVYYFLLLVMIVLVFALWKKFSSMEKVFVSFTLSTIVGFNLIFNFLLMSYHSNIWRYNFVYFPIYICCAGIIFRACCEYLKPFYSEHKVASKALLSLFLIFGYLPLFLTMIVHLVYLEEWYHNTAKQNADLVRLVIKDSLPKFIYFNAGTHTTYTDYPVRQVFKDATNEQLIQVNKILPSPIEFLFLRPGDWLFKNNQEKILKGEPILDGQYKFYGYDKGSQTIVYRLASKT